MARKGQNQKTGGFTQNEREVRLTNERERLRIIEERFISDSDLVIVRCLLEEIAFMNVELAEARQIVQAKGIVEEYQNGENQRGLKKSTAIETYDKLVNSRLRCIKQLTDMLPPPTLAPADGAAQIPGAEIERFITDG